MANIFAKFADLQWYTILAVALLAAMGIALSIAAKRIRWNSRRIANAAMCIAIAFVLSLIRLFKMPQGGSITLASSLPLIAFAVACGPLEGLLVGCAYGLLDLLHDPYIIHPLQMLIDYPLAYGALALGGFAALLPIPRKWRLPAGVVLGAVGRLAMAVLSGVVFFSEYTPEGQQVLLYSLGYNVAYLGPDAALCLVIALIPGMERLTDLLRGNVAGKTAKR